MPKYNPKIKSSNKIKQRLRLIEREIIWDENPYPNDGIINNYKDFLKVRDYLEKYQYNSVVMEKLIDLAFELWWQPVRISRLSLLQTISNYSRPTVVENQATKKRTVEKIKFSTASYSKFLQMFLGCIEKNLPIANDSYLLLTNLLNSLLIQVRLKEEEILLLLPHTHQSDFALRRIVKYQFKSAAISKWVKDNFNNDDYRNYRADLIGWMLDEDPDFVLEKYTLYQDFEYYNGKDLKAIKEYEIRYNEYLDGKAIDAAQHLVNKAFKQSEHAGFGFYGELAHDSRRPQLFLTQRYYKIPLISNPETESENYPNFKLLRESFYGNIDYTYNLTMCWSIAYSRLDIATKTRLLKKYYSENIYYSFFKICCKYKYIDVIKWLKVQQQTKRF